MTSFDRKALSRAKLNLRDQIREHADLGTTARLVGEQLVAKHVNSKNLEAWPSQETLGIALNLCARTIRRALKQLENVGIIERVASRGRTTRYCFPEIDDALNVVRGRTREGQNGQVRRASLSGQRGQQRPTTPKKNPETIPSVSSGDLSFPRFTVEIGGASESAWDEALGRQELPRLDSFELADTQDGKPVFVVPAPYPPNAGDKEQWRRLKIYFEQRKRPSA